MYGLVENRFNSGWRMTKSYRKKELHHLLADADTWRRIQSACGMTLAPLGAQAAANAALLDAPSQLDEPPSREAEGHEMSVKGFIAMFCETIAPHMRGSICSCSSMAKGSWCDPCMRLWTTVREQGNAKTGMSKSSFSRAMDDETFQRLRVAVGLALDMAGEAELRKAADEALEAQRLRHERAIARTTPVAQVAQLWASSGQNSEQDQITKGPAVSDDDDLEHLVAKMRVHVPEATPEAARSLLEATRRQQGYPCSELAIDMWFESQCH